MSEKQEAKRVQAAQLNPDDLEHKQNNDSKLGLAFKFLGVTPEKLESSKGYTSAKTLHRELSRVYQLIQNDSLVFSTEMRENLKNYIEQEGNRTSIFIRYYQTATRLIQNLLDPTITDEQIVKAGEFLSQQHIISNALRPDAETQFARMLNPWLRETFPIAD